MNRKLGVILAAIMLLAGTSAASLAQTAPSGEAGKGSVSTKSHQRLVNNARCNAPTAKVGARGSPSSEGAHQKGC